jgi:hypothetical protein
MSMKKIFSLVLISVTLLLYLGGIPTRSGPAGVQASVLGQGFTTTSSGGPISSPFVIADQPVSASTPAVAYNSQQQEYMVVWWNDRPGNDDIYGQRISKTGTRIGPWFAIAYGSGYDRRYPCVAYNSLTNEYLVTWYQFDSSDVYSVQGQRLSATGQPQGGAIDIGAGTSSLMYFYSAVAYDPTDDKYLVLYTSFVASSYKHAVLAQAFNNNGSTWGASFEIAPNLDAVGWLDLAYNSLRNEFLVVWDQTGSQADVMARRVKMTGGAGVLGSILPISTDTSNDDSLARVAAVPRSPDGQYLVVWDHCKNNPNCSAEDTQAQLVSGEGNLEGGIITFPTPFDMVLYADVAGCVQSNAYFVAWMQTSTFPPGIIVGDIAARFVSTGGGLEPEFWLGGDSALSPAVSCGPNGDYLVAFMKTSSTSDFDILGRLVGNRLYLPWVGK